MSKDIFGVFDVHPEDVMNPDWRNALPDKTGETVRFFDSLAGVRQAIIDCSKGDWTFKVPVGPEQQKLKIGSIGVVYRVAASDELLEYVQQQRQQTANPSYLFTSQLPVDAIQDTTAIIPEDVLHESQIVELIDVQRLLRTRREHMIALDELLQASKPQQLVAFDTSLVRYKDAVRLLYGNKGLLSQPNLNSEYAMLSTVLKNVFDSGKANIEYAAYTSHFYSIYQAVLLDGKQYELQLRQMRAVKATLDEIAKLADRQGDFKMRSMLYSLQNQVSKEISALTQNNT